MTTLNTTYYVDSLTNKELGNAYSHILAAKKISEIATSYYFGLEIISNLEKASDELHLGNLVIRNENDSSEQFVGKYLNTIYTWINSAISSIKGRSDKSFFRAINKAEEVYCTLLNVIW
jgi:hypothetical protein